MARVEKLILAHLREAASQPGDRPQQGGVASDLLLLPPQINYFGSAWSKPYGILLASRPLLCGLTFLPPTPLRRTQPRWSLRAFKDVERTQRDKKQIPLITGGKEFVAVIIVPFPL